MKKYRIYKTTTTTQYINQTTYLSSYDYNLIHHCFFPMTVCYLLFFEEFFVAVTDFSRCCYNDSTRMIIIDHFFFFFTLHGDAIHSVYMLLSFIVFVYFHFLPENVQWIQKKKIEKLYYEKQCENNKQKKIMDMNWMDEWNRFWQFCESRSMVSLMIFS